MPRSPPAKLFPNVRRVKVLVGGAIALVLFVIASSFSQIFMLHEQTLREVEATLSLQSLTLAESLEHSIQSVDLVLASVVEKMRLAESAGKSADQLPSREFHDFLTERASELPQVWALIIAGAEGRWINNSRTWPSENTDFSDREYFQALKKSPSATAHFSEPVVGRVSHVWMIIMSRPVWTADGKFLGAAFANMPLDYIERFFRTTSPSDGYAATLLRDDGTLLARYPPAGVVGKIAPVSVLKKMASSRSGVSRSVSPIDHEARIVSAYRLMNYPLVVVTTRSEDVAFAAWREMEAFVLFTGAIKLIVIFAGTFGVAAWWREQDRLHQSEARRLFAVEAASLGTWYRNVGGDEAWWSDRLRNMIGVPDTLPTSRTLFLSTIHPDDLSFFLENQERSISQARPYELEYRIIRANDRQLRWHNNKGDVELDKNGKPVRIYGIVQDVTERKAAEQLHKDLRRHLMQAQEQERLRLAHELHDHTGQSLAAVMMELRRIGLSLDEDSRDRVCGLLAQLEQMGKSLHDIAWELRPPSIDELGLVIALADYIAEWSERSNIEADFHCRFAQVERLSTEIKTTLYRITQEALNNVFKHALKATNVSVVIDGMGGMVQLTIEDNGSGFDVAGYKSVIGVSGGLGLRGMRERLALIDGTIEVESAVGIGTTIFVRIQIEQESMAT